MRINENLFRQGVAKVSKALKVSPTTARTVQGAKVYTNHATGTQVAKCSDGTKNIVLGIKSNLAKIFGKGATITFYPKGTFFGGEDGIIKVLCKGVKDAQVFTQKEFNEFVNLMTKLVRK